MILVGDKWAGISFARDINGSGFFERVEFLGLRILLADNRKGKVNAVKNVCQRRSSILIDWYKNCVGQQSVLIQCGLVT